MYIFRFCVHYQTSLIVTNFIKEFLEPPYDCTRLLSACIAIIPEKYKFIKVYDLVINNGTGEHIFDQYSLFKNIHNLCNLNGLMLHILPFIDWINHGFYNFHPIFFADLSAANDYEIIKLSMADRNGNEIEYITNDNTVYIKVNINTTEIKTKMKITPWRGS